MHSIISSKFLAWRNEVKYYEDMTKYAKLGSWVINSLGGDIKELSELIGEAPNIYSEVQVQEKEQIERELTESDKSWIAFAENNGLEYKITKDGIRIG